MPAEGASDTRWGTLQSRPTLVELGDQDHREVRQRMARAKITGIARRARAAVRRTGGSRMVRRQQVRFRTLACAAAAGCILLVGGCSAAEPDLGGSAEPAVLDVVGLGDSIPGALGCESPCESYVALYGDLAADELDETARVTNLGSNDSATSSSLLSDVESDDQVRTAISAADVITITVGFNDWQGPCFWSGRDACVASGAEVVSENIDKILDEITKLIGDRTAAIRVTGYYDNTIGSPKSQSDWGYTGGDDAEFAAFYSVALAKLNDAICTAVDAHGAICVDLVAPFNGARGDQDAGALLGPDHLHPSATGHELIAQTIAAVGFAPLD